MAPSGWNGVEVGSAFGFGVTSSSPGGCAPSAAGREQAVSSKQNARRTIERVKRPLWWYRVEVFILVGILEVGNEQLGDIRGGVLAEDAEEVCSGGLFAQRLVVVILEEGKEDLVANLLAQVLEEARPGQIDLVPVWALAAAVVDL